MQNCPLARPTVVDAATSCLAAKFTFEVDGGNVCPAQGPGRTDRKPAGTGCTAVTFTVTAVVATSNPGSIERSIVTGCAATTRCCTLPSACCSPGRVSTS